MLERLDEIYFEFGYRMDFLRSYTFEGAEGFVKMQRLMKHLRSGIDVIGNAQVTKFLDYSLGIEGLPKADVLKFCLSNGVELIIRPSGTEPKIKAYVAVNAEETEAAEKAKEKIVTVLDNLIKIQQ